MPLEKQRFDSNFYTFKQKTMNTKMLDKQTI